MHEYEYFESSQAGAIEWSFIQQGIAQYLRLALYDPAFSAVTAGVSIALNLPHPGLLLSLAVSAMFVWSMSGLILYQTSSIIHGGETNYVMATATLFLSIFNLFTGLLHLLGFINGQE